ncbi:MAG TPA: ROK family protein [Conexibacter sp.]|nr:ROK family protein [Conexibacter sp.]
MRDVLDSSTPISGAGAMLRLVREGRATTRGELVDLTGLARSTVSQRVDALLAEGLLVASQASVSTGGRPPTVLAFNAELGVVLAAELGVTRCHVAVTDLDANVLAETLEQIAVADGPDVLLPWLVERFDALLERIGRPRAAVRGVGVGLPAPVAFGTGRPARQPSMPGWTDVPVAERLREALGAPVLVDNDVNAMALGEHRVSWRTTDHLLFVKAGTGIGCGIVAGGELQRGAHGAAGELGHARAPRGGDTPCACGNTGCLEAIAGGEALARRLSAEGIPARTVLDVAARMRAGDRAALALARQAGRDIGDVLASIVDVLDPAVIVFGGELADASEEVIAGVREVVYQRSLPFVTRDLAIVQSADGSRAGIVGAAVLAIEHVLAPAAIDAALGGVA